MVFTSKYPNVVSVTQLGHHLRREAISSSARGARDRSVVPSSWAVPAAGQTSAGNFRILKWSYCNYRKTIVCRDIALHRPYIGLIIYICGRYLQFRFLKWPLKNWLRRSGVLEYGKLEIPNQHRWDFNGKLMELEGVLQQTMFDQRGAAWWSTVFGREVIHK